MRQQLCFFGRDCSLTEVSMVENDVGIVTLSSKTANQAGKDIADVVELHKSVTGHAVIILYRFGRAKQDSPLGSWIYAKISWPTSFWQVNHRNGAYGNI